jgi:phosphoribosylanthranilate isomerase
MSVELKIKSKHLSVESKIIRHEEIKTKWRIHDLKQLNKPVDKLENTRHSIYLHRVYDVRFEARATYLARAYIKGIPYYVVETNPRRKEYESHFNLKVLPRVAEMATKYGGKGKITVDNIKEWIKTEALIVDIETMAA